MGLSCNFFSPDILQILLYLVKQRLLREQILLQALHFVLRMRHLALCVLSQSLDFNYLCILVGIFIDVLLGIFKQSLILLVQLVLHLDLVLNLRLELPDLLLEGFSLLAERARQIESVLLNLGLQDIILALQGIIITFHVIVGLL